MHGMGGGIHGGMRPSPAMIRERMTQLAETFKEKGAVSPETAMTPEELGLPAMFGMMMQTPTPMSQSGAFVERNGKYYLVEKRLSHM